MDEILQGLGCLLVPHGWWTYEYCHLQTVSQFHMTGDRRPPPPARVLNAKGHSVPVTEDEYILGAELDVTVHPPTIVHAHNNHPFSSSSSSSSSSSASSAFSYLTLRYTHGDYCPLLNGFRSVEVRLACGDGKATIDEVQTCQYQVGLFLPQLCAVPGFEAPAVPVQAAADAADGAQGAADAALRLECFGMEHDEEGPALGMQEREAGVDEDRVLALAQLYSRRIATAQTVRQMQHAPKTPTIQTQSSLYQR